MKTVVHVNQHIIRANSLLPDIIDHAAPLTVKTYKENRKAHEVIITGPCRIVYRPHAPPTMRGKGVD